MNHKCIDRVYRCIGVSRGRAEHSAQDAETLRANGAAAESLDWANQEGRWILVRLDGEEDAIN